MRVLVSGSTGLIGTELVARFSAAGDEVTRLVRSKTVQGRSVFWSPSDHLLDPSSVEGFDAVVHLAGEPIAKGRWTPEKKARIRQSRLEGTRLLAETLSSLKDRPKVLLCASAIGIYGSRGEEILTEESGPGIGFLADLGGEWEGACGPAGRAGIRVVALRFGIVLSPKGGALKVMRIPFRLGLGGPLGSGQQWMSWISLEDAAGAIRHAVTQDSLRGPVNVVSPNPVTNNGFTRALGKALHRPAFFPLPAFAARALFGELADEALLASARVQPKRLLETGFRFKHPEIETALRELLGR